MLVDRRFNPWTPERRARHLAACAPKLSLAERLLSHVEFVAGCLEWQSRRSDDGYGIIGIGSRSDGTRKLVVAHRVSYALFVGEISDDLKVLHHCDNPPCLNPEHLFKGTCADNTADMMLKLRHNTLRGSQIGTSVLTEEQVKEIKRRLGYRNDGVLARMFGVSDSLISSIRHERSWKHVCV